MVIPLFVGRPKSIKALEAAMETGKNVLLVAQKAAAKDEPVIEDLYEVGCIANILQMLKLPDGTVKVLVEGVQRAEVSQIESLIPCFIQLYIYKTRHYRYSWMITIEVVVLIQYRLW
jgi:ATP-dependent Lon protease